MTTLTDKELIKEIKERIGSLDVRDNIERRAYEIALASLEAEPVAWKATFTQIDHEYNTFTAMYSDKAEAERWVRLHKVGDFRADITPLYTAKPVPVVPGEIADDLMEKLPKSDAWANGFRGGWNSCRAVMLQSGNFREIAETSTNSPVIPSEVLSAILKFARVRADFDDFDGDRRGIGDCLDETEHELIVTINKYASQLAVVLVGLDERAAFNAWNNEENLPIAGVSAKNAAWLAWQARAELGRSLAVNSPVTPDGWISCSERMPDTKTAVLVAVEFDRKGDWRMKWATYIPGHPDANDGWVIPGASWIPSHWMPLPEPPQEVS
ncbi:TPA: DUF551 domain-containing protein [Escherichia coli]|nr:DUF551 domain-containing protein [Escherichia coli]HAX2403570.1 DUF551 domain-containing protein [Escherichia coli]